MGDPVSLRIGPDPDLPDLIGLESRIHGIFVEPDAVPVLAAQALPLQETPSPESSRGEKQSAGGERQSFMDLDGLQLGRREFLESFSGIRQRFVEILRSGSMG